MPIQPKRKKEAPSTTIRRLQKNLRELKKMILRQRADVVDALHHLSEATEGNVVKIVVDRRIIHALMSNRMFSNLETIKHNPYQKQFCGMIIEAGNKVRDDVPI
jgi:hypothetical protein